MSEFDSLSDSDWLDVAGRVSDDNDSLSSRPLSRRSSLSIGSSHGSQVEAWEGFVDDDAVLQPAPRPADDIPDISQDDQKALDQSLVGTLSASRTSTAAHSSIRDLRLSFPDPLTSPPDLEQPISRSDSAVFSHQPATPQATDLDIVLYGSSSPIKWSLVQSLIQRAASFSGNLLLGSLDPDNGPVQTLHLRCEDDNFTITVHDCTNDTPDPADIVRHLAKLFLLTFTAFIARLAGSCLSGDRLSSCCNSPGSITSQCLLARSGPYLCRSCLASRRRGRLGTPWSSGSQNHLPDLR